MRAWTILFLSALSGFLVPECRAQTSWGSVLAETSCSGGTVMIRVDTSVIDEVPAELVGWVVDRAVLGACVAERQVGGVHPFEPGEHSYFLEDMPEIEDRKTIYFVRAVDEQGVRSPISWPRRTNWAQADCVGGPAAQGLVEELSPGYFHLDVCPDSCWWQLSMFDVQLPPEAPSLVGQIINVYGEIVLGIEGPAILVTGWDRPNSGCQAIVPAAESSWSALKLRWSPD